MNKHLSDFKLNDNGKYINAVQWTKVSNLITNRVYHQTWGHSALDISKEVRIN